MQKGDMAIIVTAAFKGVLQLVKTHYLFGIEVLTITVFPCSIQNCGPANQAAVTFTYLGDYFHISV